jgi:hypothetical protein
MFKTALKSEDSENSIADKRVAIEALAINSQIHNAVMI